MLQNVLTLLFFLLLLLLFSPWQVEFRFWRHSAVLFVLSEVVFDPKRIQLRGAELVQGLSLELSEGRKSDGEQLCCGDRSSQMLHQLSNNVPVMSNPM